MKKLMETFAISVLSGDSQSWRRMDFFSPTPNINRFSFILSVVLTGTTDRIVMWLFWTF